jgi:hypothetical protein
MSLSKLQTSRYWRTWSEVCRYHGWRNADEDRRRALHAEAGCPASMRDFGNKDFDLYLNYTATLLDQVPAPRDPERERLCYAIARDAKKGGLSDAYLARICGDRFDSSRWRDLPLTQLEQLRNTIHNRASHKKAPKPEPALAADPY